MLVDTAKQWPVSVLYGGILRRVLLALRGWWLHCCDPCRLYMMGVISSSTLNFLVTICIRMGMPLVLLPTGADSTVLKSICPSKTCIFFLTEVNFSLQSSWKLSVTCPNVRRGRWRNIRWCKSPPKESENMPSSGCSFLVPFLVSSVVLCDRLLWMGSSLPQCL